MAVEAKTPQELAVERKQAEADATNKSRSGVGTRVRVGQTRGRNPVVITWEAFDESQPDTLPKSIEQFMEVSSQKEETALVSLLIAGYNDAQYTAASDPLSEYVVAAWPQDVQNQFRLIVRNYSRAMEMSLEDAVGFVKPGFVKKYGE